MIDVAALQKVTLDIADVIITICETHSIPYYVAEGSLLGAIRHQGFIPWDEDIDLAIPRKDYDRLLPILRKELPTGYRLVEYPTCQDHPRFFAQVERLDTSVCEDAFVKPFMRHMWVDLFPLDGMPAGGLRRRLHLWRLLLLRIKAQMADADEGINTKGRHAHLRQVMIRLGNLWAKASNADARKCFAQMEQAARKYDADQTGWCISIGSLYKGRTVFPTTHYNSEERRSPFEGRMWRIPAKAEDILSSLYGDYMTLPPEDKRTGHNLIMLDKKEDKA